MDLTQKAARGMRFYKDGQLFDWSPFGGFNRFTGYGDLAKATTLQVILDSLGAKLRVAPDPGVDYDPAVQVCDGILVEYDDHYSEGTRDMTAEELASVRDALADTVSAAAKEFIAGEIDADGMILVDRLTRIDPPNAKALVCEGWLISIRKEADTRAELIRSGVGYDGDPIDFSKFGPKPHSIHELMVEAGLI